MRALILAAGFGTRMGELSITTAKPLLPVADKPIAEHLADDLFATGRISDLTVITNEYYNEQFVAWEKRYGRGLRLINDGVLSNETRLGAIADIRYTTDIIGTGEALFIMAGDNLFEFDFSEIIDFYLEKKTDVVAAYRQTDPVRLRKTGVAKLDADNRIVMFQEKPREPAGEYAVPCIYILTPGSLALISDYIDHGENTDAPGHFIKWLSSRKPVYAFIFDTSIHCVGDIESYEQTCRALGKHKQYENIIDERRKNI